MTRTRSRNDKDLRMGGDHGQMVSGGAGHSSGHVQTDSIPQTFRQGMVEFLLQYYMHMSNR